MFSKLFKISVKKNKSQVKTKTVSLKINTFVITCKKYRNGSKGAKGAYYLRTE